ncbi:unnamed protein product [Trypanosoma congolense IL3000]|uniref:WGS project CAEQ00000000 data, annotated contig 1042 n=1 Tax=Trypanosoma congolense (strain IL3000) TaxID=1068625 RepID=F9W3E3_TRYCI|nr:unnamed protein product [Trypanosoma congolense IL3000]
MLTLSASGRKERNPVRLLLLSFYPRPDVKFTSIAVAPWVQMLHNTLRALIRREVVRKPYSLADWGAIGRGSYHQRAGSSWCRLLERRKKNQPLAASSMSCTVLSSQRGRIEDRAVPHSATFNGNLVEVMSPIAAVREGWKYDRADKCLALFFFKFCLHFISHHTSVIVGGCALRDMHEDVTYFSIQLLMPPKNAVPPMLTSIEGETSVMTAGRHICLRHLFTNGIVVRKSDVMG